MVIMSTHRPGEGRQASMGSVATGVPRGINISIVLVGVPEPVAQVLDLSGLRPEGE